MPSTIVKLAASDARAWAHNQPVWLTQDGTVERAVTLAEQFALSQALKRTSEQQQSFRMRLPLEDVVTSAQHGIQVRRKNLRRGVRATPSDVTPVMECAFEVVNVGTRRVVTVWNGHLRYATGREVLAARLLADHGECVLHGRNGKCIGVLRDPLVHERSPNYGRRVQYSRNPEDVARAEEELRHRRKHGVSPVKRKPLPSRRKVEALHPPEQCPNDCRGIVSGQAWALAKDAVPPTDNEHHPVCQFAAAWKATLTPPETTSVLYDLERSKVARTAMPEEIAEADAAEKTTTMRNITVADRLYAVLPRDQAEQAEREARGETGDLVEDGHEAITEPAPALDADDEPPLALGSGDVDLEEIEPAQPGTSTLEERESWPDVAEMTASSERQRTRAEITARDYLTRQQPSTP